MVLLVQHPVSCNSQSDARGKSTNGAWKPKPLPGHDQTGGLLQDGGTSIFSVLVRNEEYRSDSTPWHGISVGALHGCLVTLFLRFSHGSLPIEFFF